MGAVHKQLFQSCKSLHVSRPRLPIPRKSRVVFTQWRLSGGDVSRTTVTDP